MRTGIDKAIDALIRQGADTQEIVEYIITNLTTKEMGEELVKSLQENQRLKEEAPVLMRITKSEFDKHFRIIGTRTDGQPETRGRKGSKE